VHNSLKQIVLCALFVCCLVHLLVAQSPPQVTATSPAAYEEPQSLPKYMTEAEKRIPFAKPTREDFESRTPPSGQVYCPPEYAPCAGLLIAWESYTTILTQLAVGITSGDPEAKVWVVVDSTSEQSSAYSTLNSAGADMSRILFIVRVTDTVWIRDYGPRFIFEDGLRAIIDHNYNRPRPNDNALNDYLSSLWGEPQYDIPLTHGGGNFHLFANGDAFMTSLILTENPSLDDDDVIQLYHDYQNVNLTIYPGFPTSFDSTQHIDMWMLPTGDYKVIIGQYSSSTGQPYTITQNAVADLTARGYTVYRTPGWNPGGTHYTYTNAVILNNQVFMSKFNVSQDATAFAVFQSAFPGYSIHQIDCTGIIGAAGALHCIVMHVPAYPGGPDPTARVLSPNGGEFWYAGHTHDIMWYATDDVGVTSVDLWCSTDGGQSYPHFIATGEANDGTFEWTVPFTASDRCRVKVVAWDGDGHSGEDVSDADFTIALPVPTVTVLSPNGGEEWLVGQEYDLRWQATDDVAVTSVDLYYSTDGGQSYPHLIATGEANDGVYRWLIPVSLSEHGRVKVVAWDGDGNSGEDVSDADFAIAATAQLFYYFPLDVDPGWNRDLAWAFGHPVGGGSHNHDPSNGYTGVSVFGYNLNGDYANNMSVRYLTTTAIDCSGLIDVELRFYRWLGAERFDHATVEVSNDGVDWTAIWQNPTDSDVSENSWSLQAYDISAIADDQTTVYIRWGMGPTDYSTTYPGWNIDDVQIWAIAPPCSEPGDMDGDGDVDGDDLQGFTDCYLLGDPAAPGCACADVDGSGTISPTDLDLFVAALLQ